MENKLIETDIKSSIQRFSRQLILPYWNLKFQKQLEKTTLLIEARFFLSILYAAAAGIREIIVLGDIEPLKLAHLRETQTGITIHQLEISTLSSQAELLSSIDIAILEKNNRVISSEITSIFSKAKIYRVSETEITNLELDLSDVIDGIDLETSLLKDYFIPTIAIVDYIQHLFEKTKAQD